MIYVRNKKLQFLKKNLKLKFIYSIICVLYTHIKTKKEK